MLGRTYAKYIFSYLFFLWKMFPSTIHIWSMNFEKQWKVIPHTIVSFLFWHMIPFITLTKLNVYFKDFLFMLLMCTWGLFKSSPPFPNLPPSHPGHLTCGPHEGSPRPTRFWCRCRCRQQYYSRGYCCNCRCSSCKVVSPTHPGPCCIPDHTRGCILSPIYLQTNQILLYGPSSLV